MAPLLLALPFAFNAWRNMSGSSDILTSLAAQGLPTSPPELNRWYAQVSPGENMALPLLEAAGAVRGPSPKETNYPYFHGRRQWLNQRSPLPGPPHPVLPEDLAQWRKLVDGMPEAWAAIERARARNRSRFPVDLRSGLNTLLPHLAPMKSLARACALRALVAIEDGRAPDAALALSDGLQVHESLLPEPLMISQLVAAATLAITLEAASDVLSVGSLPAESLLRMQRRLEALGTTNRVMAAVIGEMCLGREIFHGSPAQQAMALGMGPGAGAASSPAAVVATVFLGLYSATGLNASDERFYLTRLERVLAASRRDGPRALETVPPMDGLPEPGGGWQNFISGRMKSRMMLPGLEPMVDKDRECLARLRLGAAMLAIERFRIARDGRLPGGLGELVPEFLASVPLDPFDGQPIRYKPSPDGYTIHSIGKDRKDDDAQPPQLTKRGPKAEQDIVLRVRRGPVAVGATAR